MTHRREANNKPHDIFKAELINSMQKTGRMVRDKTQEKKAFKITQDTLGNQILIILNKTNTI